MSNLYTYRAHIIKVYDGDTVTALVDLGFHIQIEMNLRLYGIDTPEVRGEDRPQGLIARDYLANLILHHDVVIRTIKDKQEKYGRYLAVIYLDELDVNQAMIDNGYAVEYMI
jgi:micrococcal nuclease